MFLQEKFVLDKFDTTEEVLGLSCNKIYIITFKDKFISFMHGTNMFLFLPGVSLKKLKLFINSVSKVI